LSTILPRLDRLLSGEDFDPRQEETTFRIAFPLPPMQEQQRIVAKVDEVMSLCEQLESVQREREELRRDLLAALIHEAISLPLTEKVRQGVLPADSAARL